MLMKQIHGEAHVSALLLQEPLSREGKAQNITANPSIWDGSGGASSPADPINQRAPTSSISLSSIPLRSSSPPSAAPSVTQTKIRTDTLRKFAVMHIFTVNLDVPEGKDRKPAAAAARQVRALLPQHFPYERPRSFNKYILSAILLSW